MASESRSNQQNGRPRGRHHHHHHHLPTSASDLLNKYVKQRHNLKPYQVGLVWNKLGKAVQKSPKWEREKFWDNETNLKLLVVHTMQLVDDFNGQSTAAVTHSLAKLTSLTDSNLARVQSLWNALLLRTALHLKSDNFNEHSLSNLLWAYAKTHRVKTSERLLDALANTAMLRVSEFKPQGLANVAWAYATMNHQAPELFDAIVKAAQVCIDDFKEQELSNSAWAFATLNHKAPLLFDAIARTAQERIHKFEPQNLSNTAWAFATLNYKAPSLFDSIARTAQECIDDFKPQGLSNSAWAFATLNHEAPMLFDAIARTAQERIDKFEPQNISMTAWAFATLNYKAPSLFDAIARTAQECIDDFKPQELSNTAWAFAVFNIDTDSLTDPALPFAQTLLQTAPASFNVEELCQLYQFHLWCIEWDVAYWFPEELSRHCWDAFVSRESHPSRLQVDVLESLWTLQDVNYVREEVLADNGYSLDAVVLFRGYQIGVEVDGPSHFIGHSHAPNGNTVLKRRQLRTLGWTLVTVPYWEWKDVDTGSNKKLQKQMYLQNLLDSALY